MGKGREEKGDIEIQMEDNLDGHSKNNDNGQ